MLQLGIDAAFDVGEFNIVNGAPFRVSQIKHRAMVEVSKDGTEIEGDAQNLPLS